MLWRMLTGRSRPRSVLCCPVGLRIRDSVSVNEIWTRWHHPKAGFKSTMCASGSHFCLTLGCGPEFVPHRDGATWEERRVTILTSHGQPSWGIGAYFKD